MTAIVCYFQVHQPYRLQPFKPADVGTDRGYFDDDVNRAIVRRVAERCYEPMNALIRGQIEALDGRFRCAYSLSGTVIQQMRDWAPKALDSFVALAETGCVEFLCETSHHSLAFDRDYDEFTAQVENHRAVVEDLFGRRPTTFRNTELCIDTELAQKIEAMGFDLLLGEGADRLLGWRSPQFIYRPAGCDRLRLMLRDYEFSDDIAFRFSNREWPHHPLFADTFASWLHAVPQQSRFVGLFMDYETFGEHQWKETGILEFMAHLPGYVLADERFSFATPAAVAADGPVVGPMSIPNAVSWADQERDLSAWLGNQLQQEAQTALYELAPAARAAGGDLLATWRQLTTSDHVYYMCTKFFSDGDVHKYFSPYDSPHEAYVRFINVLADLKTRLTAGRSVSITQKPRPTAPPTNAGQPSVSKESEKLE